MPKKLLLLFFVTSVLFYKLPAQQSDYVKPSLSDTDSWSLVLLPDVQTYIKFDYNQPILDLMLAWVSNNVETLNTKMVLCTGDLVEQNDLFNPDGRVANQASVSQWEAVSAAFGRLDGQLPYILTIGNHDYGILSAESRDTHFDKYFPPNKNRLNQKMLRDVGLNAEGRPTLADATYEFVSPHGRKFLVLVLEFAPRDEALEWARGVIGKERYKDHTVILLTHSYMDSNNKHIVHEGYELPGPNYGEAIWQKLVQPSKNIQMVFAGHIGKPDDPKGHIAFRVDENAGGKKVSQMVFNAQALGGGWHGNGGDGWLRILEFLPDGKTVKVKTFSPLFAISPTTQKYAWRTEPHDEFTFELD
ncbi:metallophosphoesterase [uncultured Proteiniphilum sp.]|mgnify:CR=1 FL=1|uniref:metallophosphoesterase n=1 Tax=uncultured Proteiniphilum sp. TaxID=497637 RepID=UPI00261CD5B5|nr:metallophosphoesterase [uncultured Proteiniphilum sp.]